MPKYGYDEQRDRISSESELRVHGIGGSTPEHLLRDPNPVLVGGDEIAGFYRPRDETSPTEAYSWGGLTARANVRAFWILLLPFALVNVAGWMIPRPKNNEERPLIEALVRAIALGSTVALVGLAAGAVVDIVALQCGMQEECAGQSVWLDWMRSAFFLDHPTRLVVLGLVLPLIGLVLLWSLGRRSRERYEERFELPDVPDSELRNRLAQPRFWAQTEKVEALANLHIAAGLAVLTASAEWYYFRLDRYQRGITGEFEGPWTQWFTGVHVIGLLAIGLLVTSVVLVMGPSKISERWAQTTRWAAIGLFTFAVMDGLRRSEMTVACTPSSSDPGFVDCTHLTGTWFAGFTWSMVFVPLLALLIWLAVRGFFDWLEARRRGESLVLLGTGPFVAVATGLIVLTSLMAGTALVAAELLGNRPGADASPPIIRVFADWDVATLGLLAYIAALMGWALFRSRGAWLTRGRRADRLNKIEERYYESLGKPVPRRNRERERWLRKIDWRQRVRNEWVPALGQPLGLGVAVAIVMAIIYVLDREVWQGELFLRYVFVDGHAWTELLLTISRWVVIAIPVVGVALLWRSYRNPEIRRNVGTLWDVLTFWPRWFHPFAPPAYSARAVPEMVVRLQERLTKHGPVVPSAHSQGSVIAVSAILALGGRARPVVDKADPEKTSDEQNAANHALSKLALLTHGTPLGSLYGRFFPAYFSRAHLIEVAELLTEPKGPTRWRNMYRCTDPIGTPLFEADNCSTDEPSGPNAEIDIFCSDPKATAPEPGDPYPAIRGHSDYYLEPRYDTALSELMSMLEARPDQGDSGPAEVEEPD